jgi:formate dehydrogenase subunit gamma
MRFEDWNEERGNEVIVRHASQEGAALPILHALQQTFGFVPEAAISMVAKTLNLTRADVYGIVTFYHDFRLEPPGQHELRLCRSEACQAMGAASLAEKVCAALKIDWNETSADRNVSLSPVYCLGLCAVAPAGMLDGKPIGRLDPDQVVRLLGRES